MTAKELQIFLNQLENNTDLDLDSLEVHVLDNSGQLLTVKDVDHTSIDITFSTDKAI